MPVDLAKLRSIAVRGDRRGSTRTVTDELGNQTTEHADDSSRLDVTIKAPKITVTAQQKEER